MDREENLIQLENRTPEEAKAIRSKGGKARGEQRRRQKNLREQLEAFLQLPCRKNGKVNEPKHMEDDKGNMQCIDMIAVKLLQKAMKGDIRAVDELAKILDLNGLKISTGADDSVNININVKDFKND